MNRIPIVLLCCLALGWGAQAALAQHRLDGIVILAGDDPVSHLGDPSSVIVQSILELIGEAYVARCPQIVHRLRGVVQLQVDVLDRPDLVRQLRSDLRHDLADDVRVNEKGLSPPLARRDFLSCGGGTGHNDRKLVRDWPEAKDQRILPRWRW